MYKKIGIIGDLHGRNYWEELVKDKTVDLWIFLGDYVDSFHYTDVEILHNLKKVLAFKILQPEKVILLLGNHDVGYIYKDHVCLAGWRYKMEHDLYDLFTRNLEHFQMAFQYENLIFSHAGITNRWVNGKKGEINAAFAQAKTKFKLPRKQYTLVEKINWLQHTEFGRQLIFSTCAVRQEYKYNNGGLIWVDRSLSKYDSLTGFHQFVGHTPVDGFETYGKGDTTITFCDVLKYERRICKIIEPEDYRKK